MAAPDKTAVAILGAGRMGVAIGFVFATVGHPVAVHDPDPQALQRTPDELQRIARLREQTQPAVRLCERLEDAVDGAHIVIEAAYEAAELKRRLFAELSTLCDASTVLATNTSAIPIAELAAVVENPERMLGTHFWNPPYAVRLVEVTQTPMTSALVIAQTMALLRSVAMKPVHVRRDIPGFIGNRLQHALKREAIALVAAGVCDAETIDTVCKESFGRRMAVCGPLEQSDLVGLDLTLAIHETLMPSLDTTREPHPYLVEKVRSGELGIKSGRGFRTWTSEQAEALQGRIDDLARDPGT